MGIYEMWHTPDERESHIEDYDRMPSDSVRKPAHYVKGEIECIDAMRSSMSKEAFTGYCKGAVFKYLWRYESKANPLEDLNKAKVYLDWLIDEQNKEKL
tara:strand:- start:9220 stop:9516 length:297 start_codon:yes stop_codon:yes gene_type:complete